MFLYSRAVRITEDIEKAMDLAKELTRLVNANTGLEVRLWQQLFGRTPNYIAWSTVVAGRGDIAENMAKFPTLPGFIGLSEELRELTDDPVDGMRYLLNADQRPDGPPNIASVTSTQAIGKLDEAMAWAVDMAGLVTKITGEPCLVGADTVGPLGQLSWHTGAADLDTYDAHEMAMWSSEEYMERINKARDMDLFAVGSSDRIVAALVEL